MKLRTLFLAAVAMAGMTLAINSPASARDWGGPQPGYQADVRPDFAPPPPRGFGPGFDQRRPGGDISDREHRLGDWIRSGVNQGWLRGWQAQHAFRALGQIQQQERVMRWRNGGDLDGAQRFQLSQQLDQLSGFVGHAHAEARQFRTW